MVDGHEDTDLALLGGHGRRHVGPPTLVEAIGDDGPIMGLGALGMPEPLSSLQVVLAHQPPGALLRGPDTLIVEPSPGLKVALTVERRVSQDAADLADEFLAGAGAERPAPLGLRLLFDGDGRLMAPKVDGGAVQVPEAADARQLVLPPRRRGRGLPYLFRLVGTQGRSARKRWSSSSLSMVR
jgi:hypothetical protein